MRRRAFAFKGNSKDAKKELNKVLKKAKMTKSSSGDAVSFKAPGISPVHGYFKSAEEGKVTHVEMYLSTSWWFYIIMFLVFLIFVVLAYYFLKNGQDFQGTLTFFVGAFQFATMYFSARIFEKKWDIFLSHEMLLSKFF